MSVPKFVVVGHPNKGKSSLVATLAQNDQVGISAYSGTTTQSTAYSMRLNQTLCYQLVDTPGFQRAESLLSTLQQQSRSAADRADLLFGYLASLPPEQYPDEQALFAPLNDPQSAIIYVVDGSKPYRADYEAEMELLRWSGRPRMAVINPISGQQYVEQWQQALDQYFSLVRVFNPMTAPFDQQLSLIAVFSTLQPSWQEPINKALQALSESREQRVDSAITILIDGLTSMLSYQQQTSLAPVKKISELQKQQIFDSYQQQIFKQDQQLRQRLMKQLNHLNFSDFAEAVGLTREDLFDQQQWKIWGLPKQQLLLLAAGGGAAAGGVIDIGLGGSSLLMGAAIGSLVSTGSAYYWGDQLAKIKLAGSLPLGQQLWQVGPVKNQAFAWALLSRHLFLLSTLLQRSHAQREQFKGEVLDQAMQQFRERLMALSKADRASLSLWLQKPSSRLVKQARLAKILKRLLFE